MKRAALLVLATATAAASPANDGEQLARAFFSDMSQKLFAVDGALVNDNTMTWTAATDGYQFVASTPVKSVDTIHVAGTAHAMWFGGTATGTFFDQSGDCQTPQCKSPPDVHDHVSGLIADGKLLAVIVSESVTDAELFADRTLTDPPGKRAMAGDGKLGATVAAWLDGHELGKHANPSDCFAAGTGATETATGKAAIAIAAKWDKLALDAFAIDAHVLGKDAAHGLTIARVRWKTTRGTVVELRLALVTELVAGTWRWIIADYE